MKPNKILQKSIVFEKKTLLLQRCFNDGLVAQLDRATAF